MKRVILFLLICISFNLYSENKKILIISSYSSDYLWQNDYINAFKGTLGSSYDYYYFEMDTKKIKAEYFEKRADEAWKYYLNLSPDLVVIGDDNALALLNERFSLTNTPVVFLGINNNIREYFRLRPDNITGVLERPQYKRSVISLKQILGEDIKKVLVMFDNGTTSRAVIKESFDNDNKMNILGVELNVKNTNDWETWKNTIKNSSDEYDAIFLGTFQTIKDSNGDSIDQNLILNTTSQLSKIPIFSFWEFTVGKNMSIGGLVLSGKDQGVEAANIARRILEENESPRNIYPITAQGGIYVFSIYELEKWNIILPKHILEQSYFVD